MLSGLHETHVGSLKHHIAAWKMRGPAGDGSKGHWSDETICDFIVEAHERIGGPAKTGIVFATSGSGDESKRKTANARRILRYLTEDPNTEFEAIQLFNLAPSILAAMPKDLATSFLNDYLAPADFAPQGIECNGDGSLTLSDLSRSIKVDSEAHQACAAVIENPESVQALNQARKTLRMSMAEIIRKSRTVEAMLRAKTATGSAIKKMFHRKDKVPQ